MNLKVFRHLWGVMPTTAEAEQRIEPLAKQIAACGYQGVESVVPAAPNRARFQAALQEHGLAYMAQIMTQGNSPAEHLASFRALLNEAAALDPALVVCHGGRDGFEPEEATAFFRDALAIEEDVGIPVAHETHRSRILFSPWSTRRILEAVEHVWLCVDFSHWVCVCERLLGDAEEVVRLAASRARHLHARVGFEQGPQVPDPRAPEYARHLAAHEQWWDWVWDAQEQNGFNESTLTPEFGPPMYQHTMPYSREPLADLDEICNWVAVRERNRFTKRKKTEA
jgi:sugar phosphate isomerase/epimerase